MINGLRYRVALTNTTAYSNLLSAIAASTNGLPFLKTMTISGGLVSFSKNSDGSSNAAITLTPTSSNIGWAQTHQCPGHKFNRHQLRRNQCVPWISGTQPIRGATGFKFDGSHGGLEFHFAGRRYGQRRAGRLGRPIDVVGAASGHRTLFTMWAGCILRAPTCHQDGVTDARMSVLRVKDPSPTADGSHGSYILYEGRYDPGSLDKDTTYANYMLMDNQREMSALATWVG